jgi:DNA-binding CsgD family transcriptional regulator
MARLGVEERGVFAAVKRACAGGRTSLVLRECVCRILTRYLRADAYCAMELDPTTTLPVDDVNWGWPRGYEEPLVEKALFASPTADTGVLARHPRRAIIVDELLDGRPPERDPYYENHVLPFGYRHEIQFMCVSTGLPRALFTFNRKADRGPFEARHLRLLEAVAPHVAAAMHAACIRAALAERPASESGFLVIAPDGDVELASRAGARLLERSKSGGLMPIAVLLGLLRRSVRSGDAPAIATMSCTDPETGELYRLVAERTAGRDGRARGLLLIEPARPIDSLAGLLRLGLTPREAAVVSEVMRDENLASCATRLRCAEATVSKHLKSVFAKLSIGSRRELALRLLGAPPNFSASPAGLP